MLFTALSVFGIGITIIDFLGIFDNIGQEDSGGTEGESSGGSEADGTGHHGSYLSSGHTGFRAVTCIMNLLRSAVYFSLGFGPTGLFALFKGLSRSTSLLWAGGMGLAITVLAWFLRRLIRQDLDSSIKNIDFLMETGALILPLEGDSISKILVQKFGKETEVYVKSKDTAAKLPKGHVVRIIDYDKEIYWIESAE